jgi:hypothetical protein
VVPVPLTVQTNQETGEQFWHLGVCVCVCGWVLVHHMCVELCALVGVDVNVNERTYTHIHTHTRTHACADMNALEAAFTSKTKVFVLNTPHNPTGKIFDVSELHQVSM